MTPAEIKDRIISILQADSGIISFGIKKFYEGIRDRVPDDNFPYIVIEPEANNDGTRRDLNGTIDNEIVFMIAGVIKEREINDQIDNLFELETLIKKALCQDVSLGGKALNFRFQRTEYDRQLWPVRAVVIDLAVEYRQNFKTRV